MLKLWKLLLLLMLMLKLLLMLEFVMAKVESWCVGCRCLLEDGECEYMLTPIASGESASGGKWGRSVLAPQVAAFIALCNERKSKLRGDIGLNSPIT